MKRAERRTGEKGSKLSVKITAGGDAGWEERKRSVCRLPNSSPARMVRSE
jgi:hypothetical protein